MHTGKKMHLPVLLKSMKEIRNGLQIFKRLPGIGSFRPSTPVNHSFTASFTPITSLTIIMLTSKVKTHHLIRYWSSPCNIQ